MQNMFIWQSVKEIAGAYPGKTHFKRQRHNSHSKAIYQVATKQDTAGCRNNRTEPAAATSSLGLNTSSWVHEEQNKTDATVKCDRDCPKLPRPELSNTLTASAHSELTCN